MRLNDLGRVGGLRPDRGSIVLMTVLVVLLLLAAGAHLFLSDAVANLVVLACLALLSTAGVVALFAGAAGMIAIRRPLSSPALAVPQAQAVLENMAEGVLLTNAAGVP